MLLLSGVAYAQISPSGVGRPRTMGDVGTPFNSSSNRGNNSGFNNNSNNYSNNPADTNAEEMTQKGIEHHEDIPDSILLESIFQFHYTPLAVKILSIDHPNLDPSGAQFCDPIDALNGNYFLNKGIAGQSNQPIFCTLGDSFSPQLQPITNHTYRKTPQSILLYQVQKPYSVLGYAGSLNKDNHLYLTHTQNINQRWNVAFNYHLIRSEGVYANSGDKNHYLDFSTNYYSRDARYQAQAAIIWQKENLSENGGIIDDDYVRNNPNATQSGIPVNSINAASLTNHFTAFAHQSYNTVKQVYSLRERDSLSINIVDSTKFDTIKIFDTILPSKPHLLNTGVFGMDLQWDALTRKYTDSTRWNHLNTTLYWTNDAYPDFLWHNPCKLTIGYTLQRSLSYINQWQWHQYAGPLAQLEIHPYVGVLTANINMLQNYGNRYAFNYLVPLDSAHHHQLQLHALTQTQEWDIIYQHFAQQNNISLTPTATTKFQLSYLYKELFQLDLTARHIEQNAWLQQVDSITLIPQQTPNDCWVLQAKLLTRLTLGWFHYDMQQLLQHSTDLEQVRVPLFASKNSLYANVHLFNRALQAQIGIDIRYHSTFYADAYNPYWGLFYRQNQTPIGNYFMGDIFINLQVKRATIYAKAGHLNSLIEQHPNYFLLPHYPANRLGLFFGLTWKFFD